MNLNQFSLSSLTFVPCVPPKCIEEYSSTFLQTSHHCSSPWPSKANWTLPGQGRVKACNERQRFIYRWSRVNKKTRLSFQAKIVVDRGLFRLHGVSPSLSSLTALAGGSHRLYNRYLPRTDITSELGALPEKAGISPSATQIFRSFSRPDTVVEPRASCSSARVRMRGARLSFGKSWQIKIQKNS